MNEQKVLEKFLCKPLSSSLEVFEEFLSLNDYNVKYSINQGKKSFVYIPGKRKDRVLLVAHADTVWDKEYGEAICNQELKFENGFYRGKIEDCGIGADDRAGCAMLYLLKDSGHSLLITDGEETGQIGANYIKNNFPVFYEELNNHSYMVQLDRRNANDYKTYNLKVSQEFCDFIEENTGYVDAGKNSSTDIIVLCEKICGVNLSVGYYNEHTEDECLNYSEWLNTLEIVKKMISGEQKKFLLEK